MAEQFAACSSAGLRTQGRQGLSRMYQSCRSVYLPGGLAKVVVSWGPSILCCTRPTSGPCFCVIVEKAAKIDRPKHRVTQRHTP